MKMQREQRKISSVTNLHDRKLTASNISAQLNQCHGKNVLTSTVRRRLCEAGLYGRIAAKKPMLKKQNNVRRLQWTKVLKDWTIKLWNKVLWTDESEFRILGSIRRVYMWWRVRKSCNLHIALTVKYGGGSVMVGGGHLPVVKLRICARWRTDWIKLLVVCLGFMAYQPL